MDNLVLIRVAAELDRELQRAVLREVRDEGRHRLRLIFDGPQRVHSVLVSLRPELPWIGRPAGQGERPRRLADRFAAAVNRALQGVPVSGVEKPTADRWVRLRFADGRALVAELATHGANLVLVEPDGATAAAARSPRSARGRIASGSTYRPPDLPRHLLNPFRCEAAEIDRLLGRHAEEDSPLEVLRRRVFGVGSQGARLVLEESRRTGRSAGAVLEERISALARGEAGPVVRAERDPLEAAEEGDLDPQSTVLLPWIPDDPAEAARCFARQDAAATAGWYHEAVERAAAIDQRLSALRALLQKEIARVREAEARVARDIEGFEDPEKHRRWGEALLAGLGRARRVGEVALVPDPYDPDGAEIAVPAPQGRGLQQAAEQHFRSQRRARRGLEQAQRRAEWLARRRGALEEIEWSHAEGRGRVAVEELERAMRGEGMPVGLEPATREGRAAAARGRPRLEGVRVFTSSEGTPILVGRAGRHNHRLTFKLAAPDDFWLHAGGCPGAHVVVRNEGRRARPSDVTLREAAALAAWYSEGREQEYADVQWTRRKYVRRPRGAAPGTVVLKRFETIRVRPGLPPSAENQD